MKKQTKEMSKLATESDFQDFPGSQPEDNLRNFVFYP